MAVGEVIPFELVPPACLRVLDQTRLPQEEVYLDLRTVASVIEAIQSLRVRGAPFLGLVGAAGLAVAANERGPSDSALRQAAEELANARPTAVDLSALVHLALGDAFAHPEGERIGSTWSFASKIAAERAEQDLALGRFGAEELAGVDAVLTHCNTGALATGGIGSALGVIRTAFERGTLTHCYATETRPLLQGARLTAWELTKLGIPSTLLPDTAAAMLTGSGRVGAVITGADRIARNGDTANKIGTFGLALAARQHGIPFYIAAPASTFDANCPDGAAIPIEFRDSREVGGFGGVRWSPDGLDAYNPAFDVTSEDLITAFITERGILRPPFSLSITAMLTAR